MGEAGAVEVAVIIVSYRSAALTIDCLRSVAAERDRPGARIRCVVVDNASGDAPLIEQAIAAEAWGAWVRVITTERNGGFAYGNNVGLRLVYADGKPDYVHLLNPDTVLRPGAIAALVEFLEPRPQVGIAGGIFENADQSEWAVAFRFPSAIGELIQGLQWGAVSRVFDRWQVAMHLGHSAHPVDWVSGASMMLRRELVERIGGLDESFFLYFEETEFCFRAKAAGYEVWYVPASRVLHIAGQSTKVTERNKAPRRLPAYWFASRSHYFALTGGTAYAVLADLTGLIGGLLGAAKRLLQARPPTEAPHFLRDMLAHSPFWRRNRGTCRERVVPRF